MSIDITGGLRAILDDAEQRARHHESSGANKEAAAEYRRCAKLMRDLVTSATSTEVQQQRLEKARNYLERAKQLESGPSVNPGQLSGKTTESGTGEDLTVVVSQFIQKTEVGWDAIGGLEDIKREIQSFYAISMASAPAGVSLRRQQGILLYGPPGTGKTLLAAATSHGLCATFFNVKVSGLLSKYFGESARLVTALFEEARRQAPAVIFVDEIDALAPSRDGGAGGTEKRLLSTLLSEMDGLSEKGSAGFLLTIGATNIPWEMDSAILSRFGKLVYVPLPDDSARAEVLEIHLTRAGFTFDLSCEELVKMTAGYSGRDLEQFCTSAIEKMLMDANHELVNLAGQGAADLAQRQLVVKPISRGDFSRALSTIRPVTNAESLARYQDWRSQLK